MGFYDDEKNVRSYLEMAEGYDGAELIQILRNYLLNGATVLELGMGPGKDLDILGQDYVVSGSDNSQTFLDLYRKKNKQADLLLLDAITINTDRQFDCIYSNKVLHHLDQTELMQSLQRQKDVVRSDGILFHSFWYGDHTEEHHGLRFTYYTEAILTSLIDSAWEIVLMERYAEMEADDSIYILLKKK